MDVTRVPDQIHFIAPGVFLEPVLPYGLLTFVLSGQIRWHSQIFPAMFAEPGFDEPPAQGKITIAGWQTPNAMEMIGHDHHGLHNERIFACNVTKRLAQSVDIVRVRKQRPPFFRHQGEEKQATGNKCAPVLHFGCGYLAFVGWSSGAGDKAGASDPTQSARHFFCCSFLFALRTHRPGRCFKLNTI